MSIQAAGEVDDGFPVLLSQQFSQTVQLSALLQLTHYLAQLPVQKPKSECVCVCDCVCV